jgi:biopolymer transport protein ExbB
VNRLVALAVLLLLLPASASAWWNEEWTARKKIALNTTEYGAATREALAQFVIPVRLHTGNFLFSDAKPDAKDIRFVASDDKTPLKFHIERFDAANDLAIIWVQVPRLPGASNSEFIWMYYGNQKAAAGEDAKGIHDANTTVVFHFAEKDGPPRDRTAFGNHAGQSSATVTDAGLIGPAAVFDGKGKITVGASPSLKVTPAQGLTWSAWVKPASAQGKAVLFSQSDGAKSIAIVVEGDAVVARVASGQGKTVETSRDARLTAGVWNHVAVAFKDRIAVYINGNSVAEANVAVPEMGGGLAMGEGYAGEVDEVQLSNVERGADWIRALVQSQGPDGKLIAYGESEGGESGGGASYFTILLSAVTLDGWIVIGILMVMMILSFGVMVGKAMFIAKTARSNAAFREHFAELAQDLTALAKEVLVGNGVFATRHGSEYENSSLYRVYKVGIGELLHRFDLYEKQGAAKTLSPQALDAIRASIDAGLVRENERMNRQMVLLTIAISGGPFLGLLGTVVGVMITFAAIAAVGDVNVNSIAPGIAAALVATVAGLGVAIPALFGYNYLASRIRSLGDETTVFADELLTWLAETYSN